MGWVTSADPAATVIVLSPSGDDFEVLMVERNPRGFFGSLWVFPGGGVSDLDETDDEDMSHRNAAMRELGEEAGFVLTSHGAVQIPQVKDRDYYPLPRARRDQPGDQFSRTHIALGNPCRCAETIRHPVLSGCLRVTTDGEPGPIRAPVSPVDQAG